MAGRQRNLAIIMADIATQELDLPVLAPEEPELPEPDLGEQSISDPLQEADWFRQLRQEQRLATLQQDSGQEPASDQTGTSPEVSQASGEAASLSDIKKTADNLKRIKAVLAGSFWLLIAAYLVQCLQVFFGNMCNFPLVPKLGRGEMFIWGLGTFVIVGLIAMIFALFYAVTHPAEVIWGGIKSAISNIF